MVVFGNLKVLIAFNNSHTASGYGHTSCLSYMLLYRESGAGVSNKFLVGRERALFELETA